MASAVHFRAGNLQPADRVITVFNSVKNSFAGWLLLGSRGHPEGVEPWEDVLLTRGQPCQGPVRIAKPSLDEEQGHGRAFLSSEWEW